MLGTGKPNDIVKIDSSSFNNETEFFVEMFDLTLSKYVKKGLHRDYVEEQKTLKTISKIDFSKTINTSGFKSKSINCVFDEFSSDNYTNQFILHTIYSLLKTKVSKEKTITKKKLVFFNNVSYTKIDKTLIGKIKSIRGNSTLNFLINISKYIYNNIGFDEKEGKYDLGEL